MQLDVALGTDVAGRCRLGVLALEGVTVAETSEALVAEIEAYGSGVRERHGAVKSGEFPGTEDARTFYKALGLDPTKTRPSNEAMLRRVLKGEGLYRINTLVDALNLCSLREQLPFGLYDLDRVRLPIVLRKGGPGEGYEGIRKGFVNVEGRPVLVDADGPFGNPTSDSARSMIRLETRRALVTCYAPASCGTSRMESVLDRTQATLMRFCGGSPGGRVVV